MKCDDCCQDGGNNFAFDIVDPNEVSNMQFFVAGENNMISVTYVKDDVLYFSNSFNCGTTFSPPQQLLALKGGITPLQFVAKGGHIVMAFIETIGNQRYKRAVAGSLNHAESTFSFRVCESNPTGKNKKRMSSSASGENISSVSVTICDPPGEIKSYDHSFMLEEDGSFTHICEGHG